MGAGSRGLSGYIVEQCEKNPKVAFLLVPLGIWIAYSGISDASHYQSLSDRPTQTMKVIAIESKTNDRGFSVPHVTGATADGEVSIPVSAKRARTIPVGEEVGFVETDDDSARYELRSTLDDQLSQIFFTIAGLPFNFIALLGTVITIGACGWGALAKPKSTDDSSTPPASDIT